MNKLVITCWYVSLVYYETMADIRLNKAIATLGICSRRTADEFISKGMVCVNGIKITVLGTKVKKGDIVSVNGIEYGVGRNVSTSIWLYNKPVGLVTTHKDEKGRETVFDVVSEMIGERVISVGRLDINSEGLLLLTNSSEFACKAEKSNWERHYRVRVFGNMPKDFVDTVNQGIAIDGTCYSHIHVSVQSSEKKHHWCLCVLKEGKNREIRKIFNHFGLQVSRLIRTKYGKYELGNLKSGTVKKIKL